MGRNEVLEIVDAAYAARVAGTRGGAGAIWDSPAYETFGEVTLLRAFTATSQTESSLRDLVAVLSAERLDSVVEGRSAAVLSRASLSFGGRPPFETLLYDLWEIGEAGAVTSLQQFADTARFALELEALANDWR